MEAAWPALGSSAAVTAEQGSNNNKRVDLHQGSSQLPGRGSNQSVKSIHGKVKGDEVKMLW